jgi:hypothetical protein
VERLAAALSRPRTGADAVPRAEVEVLARRLDATIGRLKAALRAQEAAEGTNDDEREG